MLRNSFFFVLTGILLLFSAGCEANEHKKDEVQLKSLNGDSENWNLNGYELKIEDDEIFAGNGKLDYKADGDISDYISFKIIAVINDEEVELQWMKIVNSESDFSNIETGSATQEVPLIKGKKVRLTDIDNYYAVIEWESSGERKSEQIKDLR